MGRAAMEMVDDGRKAGARAIPSGSEDELHENAKFIQTKSAKQWYVLRGRSERIYFPDDVRFLSLVSNLGWHGARQTDTGGASCSWCLVAAAGTWRLRAGAGLPCKAAAPKQRPGL